MSGKKNLLNESQVRQFMKLANLRPLTQGFVEGLTETADTEEELEELRTGRTGALGPKDGTANPGHGRGQGEAANGSLFEEELPGEGEEELEMGAEEELPGGGEEELEADVEMEPEVGPDEGRMVSVDDFLAALETALEDAIGDEVEIDSDEMEDEEGGAPDDFAPEGDEAVADVEMGAEEEMMEGWEHPKSATGAVNTHKGSKQHPDHRNKKNPKGELASQGPGLVKEEDGSEEGDESATHPGEKDYTTKKGDKKKTSGKKWGTAKGDEADVNESTNDLVEEITKRVAARILKSALKK